jgi:DNA-binding CsgD family transcriptional regulator
VKEADEIPASLSQDLSEEAPGLEASAIEEPLAGTRRIDQIVELASQGFTDKEIAQQLGLSKNTVDTHWKRLRAKLGVPNRTAAVMAHLRETVERQSQELREAHDKLSQLYTASVEGMGTLLGLNGRELAVSRALSEQQGYHLRYFEQASHMAHLAVYELKSLFPVEHRYVSSSARTFQHDPQAMQEASATFYDVIHPDDLPLLYEKSLGSRFLAEERYVYLYRLLMPEARWVMDTHQAVYDAKGIRTGVLGVVLDVHELVLAGLLSPVVSCLVFPAPPISSPNEDV